MPLVFAPVIRASSTTARPARQKTAKGVIDKFPKEIQAIMNKPASERTPYEQQINDLAYRQVEEEFDVPRDIAELALWLLAQRRAAAVVKAPPTGFEPVSPP